MKLSNIFKRKPKKSAEELEQERITKEAYESREIRGYCGYCKQAVELNEPWTKQMGNHYHRKCWKEMVRNCK